VNPPVVLVGIDSPIGLTVVRELGERGVEVHGIARRAASVGLHSRWLKQGYLHPERDSTLLELVRSIQRREGARFLMAISESDILFLNQHRDALAGLMPLYADAARMQRVLDKEETYRAAREVGIAVPRSFSVTDETGLAALRSELRFPVVLKWADPNKVGPELQALGLPIHKAEYAYDEAALRAIVARYARYGRCPIIQEFAPGYGLGQMAVVAGGQAVLRFQHRRLHEWPPEGGVSSLCESVSLAEHRELFVLSEQLLLRIDWEGPAMVEYRWDPATRRAVLMEINGRFWGSIPLAYHAGAHFAWATYAALGLRRPIAPAPYRAGVRCKYFIPDSRRLLTILARADAIQNRELVFSRWAELLDFVSYPLHPNRNYYVFSARDPGPFLADAVAVAKKAARTLLDQATSARR
jgi:predicted ATP-grasp superfamily ATP-dependent carboligase